MLKVKVMWKLQCKVKVPNWVLFKIKESHQMCKQRNTKIKVFSFENWKTGFSSIVITKIMCLCIPMISFLTAARCRTVNRQPLPFVFFQRSKSISFISYILYIVYRSLKAWGNHTVDLVFIKYDISMSFSISSRNVD